jgi:hypothetical protein
MGASTNNDLESWVRSALKTYLAELREFIVISGGPGNRYFVQASGSDDGDVMRLHCEAVSDEFLDEEHWLTNSEKRALASLGWNLPGTEGCPNWWKSYEISAADDIDEPARLLAATLHGVYKAPQPSLDIEFGRPAALEDLHASDALRALILDLRS